MPLFVCATPIGNLEDCSPRLARTLKEADLVLAEDTRRAAKLLHHFGITARMSSMNQHSEASRIGPALGLLQQGKNVALVTDSGTPTVSDPGGRLVAAAHQAGIKVVPVPGPSAVTAALSAAGMPADRFCFSGFPPKKGRQGFFTRLLDCPETAVIFESPFRIQRTLADIAKLDPRRKVVVCRELTKVYEEILSCAAEDAAAKVKPRGEFVVVIEKKKREIT
ncbi:MAG: 16S rRNA (cytidine(1402)-2'-O)-methyltransferase [Nanoarchaeota archaeon]